MPESKDLTPVNFMYKARIFEMLYSDKKELLNLYNAVNGTAYDDPKESYQNFCSNTRRRQRR